MADDLIARQRELILAFRRAAPGRKEAQARAQAALAREQERLAGLLASERAAADRLLAAVVGRGDDVEATLERGGMRDLGRLERESRDATLVTLPEPARLPAKPVPSTGGADQVQGAATSARRVERARAEAPRPAESDAAQELARCETEVGRLAAEVEAAAEELQRERYRVSTRYRLIRFASLAGLAVAGLATFVVVLR